MIAQLKKSLEDLEQDLLKHTKKANSYGCKWATRADKAGLVIRDAQTRNVIKWFSELTPQSLRADYIRERREKKT